MRRHPCATPKTRREVAVVLALSILGFHSPASSATFHFFGDGSAQTLNWMWSRYHPVESCFTSLTDPCGQVFAANGEIPLTGYRSSINPANQCLVARGMLDWTAGTSGPTGQLAVVALTNVVIGLSHFGCYDGAEGWASVNARDTRLNFIAVREVGDPPTLDLQIIPRLQGTITQSTEMGSSIVTLQFMMAVDVNGTEVSGDTLFTQVSLPDSSDSTWTPEFPGGPANSVTIPGLSWNSEISIMAWAYMRGEAVGDVLIVGSSPYGDGPALVIEARAVNAVGVDDEQASGEFWVSARPNPAARTTRILYTVPRPSDMRLSIYDVAGSKVASLAERNVPAGSGAVAWDGRDSGGSPLATGLYFVELVAGSRRTVAKVALLGP